MKRIIAVLFILGVLLAAYLRFNHATNNPPALFSDEVEAGYQAFVLNSCGNDYYGNRFPTHFQSIAEWKSPLNIYSIALMQRIIGNNELAVRLPAIIFGILSTVLFSLIILKIFNNYWIALLGLFLIAINPWLIHYSRAGWEVSGMITCFLGWLLFWLLYLQKHKLKWLVISLIFLAGTFYFYSTAKLFVLLLIFPVLLIWKQEIRKFNRQHLLIGFIIFGLLSLPMVRDTLNGRSGFRFSYINIFTDPVNTTSIDYSRYEDALIVNGQDTVGVSPDLKSKIFHNKLVVILSRFTRNYFSSFSTDFLFLKGDENLRQGFGKKGNFYYPDLLFLLIGLTIIIQSLVNKQKNNPQANKFSLLMLGILLLAPVPYSLTRDSQSPHSTRLILMAIPIIYFVIIGVVTVVNRFQHFKQLKYLLITVLIGVYGGLFADFYHFYFYHYPQIAARSWHYGLKQAVLQTKYLQDQNVKIYYSDSAEPFLPFFLYYTQYLPSDRQCVPANMIQTEHNTMFNGLQIENKYYLGHLEWGPLFQDKLNYEDQVFVITANDLAHIKSNSKEYGIKLDPIYEMKKDYTEQEIFYVTKFISVPKDAVE